MDLQPLSAGELDRHATEQKTGLIVLAGPSAAGKSALAASIFPDHMISMLSHHRYTLTGDHLQSEATPDAERLENLFLTLRLRRGELTVVDARHLQAEWRRTGFTTDPGIIAALRRASDDLGLDLLVRRADDDGARARGALIVSRWDGEPDHVFGQRLDSADLRYLLGDVDTTVCTALAGAHQVTLAAPDFGADGNVLFSDVLPMSLGDGPACHHCGCTQNYGCEQGCWWAPTVDRVPLCSSCTRHAADHGITLAA